MRKERLMPRSYGQLNLWLKNFAAKPPHYTTKYNVSNDELGKVQNATLMIELWLNVQNQAMKFATKVTAYKNELFDGIESGQTASEIPQVPQLFDGLMPISPGLVKEVIAIANSMKKSRSTLKVTVKTWVWKVPSWWPTRSCRGRRSAPA